MSEWVAIDTSVLVGVMNPADNWHAKATALMNQIQAENQQIILFDCVLAECVSVICRRLEEKGRTIEVNGFLTAFQAKFPPTAVSWILPDVPKRYTAVLQLIQQSGGKLNFNDALIALACQQLKIPKIASFDTDFDQVPWVERIFTTQK